MSKGQTLRVLVNERLAAAAEDIFVLFERTIAEYEEELHRFKEENQRKQQLLDTVLNQIELVRGNVQTPSASPGPALDQDIPETPRVKEEPEEQGVKQEDEHLPVPVAESSGVCVKTEESSLLQQRQTELREEPEDLTSDTEGHTDNDDWGLSLNFLAAQMETEADGGHYSQVRIRGRSSTLSPVNQSAPQTSVHRDDGAEWQHQCSFCNLSFGTLPLLQNHVTVHTGENPHSWSVSDETFAQKGIWNFQKRTYTGDKAYICMICEKTFTQKSDLEKHSRIHTGEKPFCCAVCEKTFAQKGDLEKHNRTHTGEKPFSCSVCEKTFAQKGNLERHKRTHTGERPYSCRICERSFTQKSDLDRHEIVHAGDKPYTCLICNRAFAYKCDLKLHKRTHKRETLQLYSQKVHVRSHMNTHYI